MLPERDAGAGQVGGEQRVHRVRDDQACPSQLCFLCTAGHHRKSGIGQIGRR